MKKTLIALAAALSLTIGLVGSAGAADRPTRDSNSEPWWVTGGHVTIPAKNACGGGPFGDMREYGRPQPGR